MHTPASIVNSYGGEDPWERFLDDLRNLNEGYVLGVNDYLFVDGYERVRDAHRAGDLPNIAAVFPVVEFRLAHLVGTHGHLNRINAHVIFSNEITPDGIRGQFINGLSSSYTLDPESGLEGTWSGIPTAEGLEEFGRAIRASIPPERRHEFSESDLTLGFNNLVVPLEAIAQRMNDSAFRDKAILAVGKTEWESMEWNDKSIALKKTLINAGELVFTAAADLASYQEGRRRLQEAGIHDKLVDCSDAHAYSSSTQKDRIGHCMTWMNADPTFEGLLHAVTEFDERVFVGPEPPKLQALRDRPDHHIAAVGIRRRAGHEDAGHDFFDVKVPLNPGFVAIVGNKGKGKSALLDAIGLAAGSRNERHFTFLSEKRFRNPIQNVASSYEVSLEWRNGEHSTRGLHGRVPEDDPERVTYLPQDLIDVICSADPGDGPARRFASELGKVLFAHVTEPDRLGTNDLESLITARTGEIERRMQIMRGELAATNKAIASEEERSLPEKRKELVGALQLAKQQLAEHEAIRPPDPQKPPEVTEDPILAATNSQLEELRTQRKQLEAEQLEIERTLVELATLADDAEQLRVALRTIENELQKFDSTNRPRADRLGLGLDQILSVNVDRSTLETRTTELSEQRAQTDRLLDSSDDTSIPARIAGFDQQIEERNAQLEGPTKEYANQVKALEEWEKTRSRLSEGTANEPGVKVLEVRLDELDGIPANLERLRQQRHDKVRELHAGLVELAGVYTDLYKPALQFIRTHPLATAANLEFGVDLQHRDLATLFWEIYGRNVAGSFQGRDGGTKLLEDLIEKTDFNDVDGVVQFVVAVDDAIHHDVRDGKHDPTDPFRAIRIGHTLGDLYDLIFGLEYLEPVYALEYSGVPIDRLSPGEKGTLLLMFYLLVDRSMRPLLLDQPDENLDNQTIKELLVPAIKEAKSQRQVVVITHNPNVAVVADADQIIAASFDEGVFTYESGSIESWPINKHVVDVLEGTWPAIANRNEKYQKPNAL